MVRTSEEIFNEFRTLIRTAATDANKSIGAFVLELFDSSKHITLKDFESGVYTLKNAKKVLSKADISDIFEECNEASTDIISCQIIADFCQRNMSRARGMALKLRSAIISKYKNEAEYRKLFSTAIKLNNGKSADPESFREFAEEVLDCVIDENDGIALYKLFDVDGDSKLSVDDFVNFLLAEASIASKALKQGSGDAIVDIKVSTTKAMDVQLQQQGYVMIGPSINGDNHPLRSASTLDIASFGSFGRGQSIWVWRRSQGTCHGRLKPIVDIQLDSAAMSSPLVLSGYTCLPIAINRQYVWIRRATSMDEESDTVVDICVTVGKMKHASDAIWTSPGVGWVRVDGNFGKGMMSQFDAFVWFRPLRARSLEAHMVSPIRTAVSLSEDSKLDKLFISVQTALRNYIPLSETKRLATLQHTEDASGPASAVSPMDFTTIFHKV